MIYPISNRRLSQESAFVQEHAPRFGTRRADLLWIEGEAWQKLLRGETPTSQPPPVPVRPEPIVPSPTEQAAWLARVLPICQTCDGYKGIEEKEGARLNPRIKCENCRTCGQKSVSAVQPCPLGKWARFQTPSEDVTETEKSPKPDTPTAQSTLPQGKPE